MKVAVGSTKLIRNRFLRVILSFLPHVLDKTLEGAVITNLCMVIAQTRQTQNGYNVNVHFTQGQIEWVLSM